MKSLINVYNLKSSKDTKIIKDIITSFEGIIACEISLKNKEIQIIYDESALDIDDIKNSLEISGFAISNH